MRAQIGFGLVAVGTFGLVAHRATTAIMSHANYYEAILWLLVAEIAIGGYLMLGSGKSSR